MIPTPPLYIQIWCGIENIQLMYSFLSQGLRINFHIFLASTFSLFHSPEIVPICRKIIDGGIKNIIIWDFYLFVADDWNFVDQYYH